MKAKTDFSTGLLFSASFVDVSGLKSILDGRWQLHIQ
jgi:hypothetical protein